MANTTEATYSFTTKIGNDLLTVRGNTIDEFAMNLASLHDHVEVIELITTIQSKLKPGTVADIQKALGGTIIPDPLAAKPTPPAPVRPAGFSPAPTNAPTVVPSSAPYSVYPITHDKCTLKPVTPAPISPPESGECNGPDCQSPTPTPPVPAPTPAQPKADYKPMPKMKVEKTGGKSK